MLHPLHDILHRTPLTDWICEAPFTAGLACGFGVRFEPKACQSEEGPYHSLKVCVRHQGEWSVLEHCMIDGPEYAACSSFLDTLHVWKEICFYDRMLDIYQRLQRALILLECHGTWQISIEAQTLIVHPLLPKKPPSSHALSPEGLPADLVKDLLALEDNMIVPFGEDLRAMPGEFQCVLPASAHQRLCLFDDPRSGPA